MLGRLMVEKRAKKMTQGQLAALVWPGDSSAETTRKGDISRIETGKVAKPQPTTVTKIAKALGITPAEIADLRRLAQLTPAEQLDQIPTLSRDQLELLASRFEVPTPHALSDAAIREVLTHKAEEYRSYRTQIEALDDRVAAIGNLKGAAQDAANRLDFEEVETLLSRVQEVELDIAAQTSEARAANALLRNRPDQAFTLLSAAADSFAAVDPLEPARRKLRYEDQLCQHGHRYGGTGLSLSEKMIRAALSDDLRTQDVRLWTAGQNALAIALFYQASSREGATGAALLAEAVDALRAALKVRSRSDHPVNWAATQNNLANTLAEQASRTGGVAGAALLGQAVEAHRAALQIYTRTNKPKYWAMTQNNLALALVKQAYLSDRDARTALMGQAVKACRASLQIRTRAVDPMAWALTQNNLAAALSGQANCSEGETGADLCIQAAKAVRAALQVYTRTDHPMAWATAQTNLADTFTYQARRSEGGAGATLFRKAVDAYQAALQVHTRADHPVTWAMTQENLAIAEFDIASHSSTKAPEVHLAAALVHVDAALTIFDPLHFSYNHTKATTLRNRILALQRRTTP